MAEPRSELARLKDLLLQPEATRLDHLQRQVERLDGRVGSRERLEEATAEILVDAFRKAETQQHRELARAVAPVVVAAIQSEIRNSRDMMVEALYPITGRLVAAAVADAFRGLVASINARVDTMMSMRLWKLRLKAWVTRRPLSELLLAEATRPRLLRILLLERGSGTLLASWADGADANDQSDLVSGMIAAIMEFSSSVFERSSGELRTIDMGASRILLHPSARSIVAGEVAGPMSPQDEAALHEEFAALAGALHEARRVGQDELAEAALHFHNQTQSQEAERRSALGVWLVIAVVIAALGWFGWRTWSRANFENGLKDALNVAIETHASLQAYPLLIDINHSKREVRLTGLAPSNEDAQAVRQAIAAKSGEYKLASHIGIVVSNEAAARAISAMRQDMEARKAETETLRDTLAAIRSAQTETAAEQERRTAALGAQIGAVGDEVKELPARIQQQVETLRREIETPRATANAFMRRNAVFFERDAALREPERAARTLDELARLIKAAQAGVRIVGYSSESGSVAGNQRVAQERVRVVQQMLEDRGVPRQRMVIAVRAANNSIDMSAEAPGHSNRRVEFEPLFETEVANP